MGRVSASAGCCGTGRDDFVLQLIEANWLIFVAALLVGVVDTAGRTLIPMLFGLLMGPSAAANAGPAVASILIYVLMAGVLFWKPRGLFPAHG